MKKMESNKLQPKGLLSGLVEEYNSEGSDSDEKLLHHSVNNFLSEIAEINVPLRKTSLEETFWQECYDKSTGYPYYWNTKTDEVTWDMPEEYRNYAKNVKNKTNSAPAGGITKLNRSTFENAAARSTTIENKERLCKEMNNKWKKPNSDSDDEKITLINSYEGHSSSDEEKSEKKEIITGSLFPINETVSNKKNSNHPNSSENQQSLLIGQELPATIYSISKNTLDLDIITEIENEKPPDLSIHKNSTKDCAVNQTSSISLVAGYGEDSDVEEEIKIETLPFIPKETVETNTTISHSTLFPNPTPIDVSQFAQSDAAQKEVEDTEVIEPAPNESSSIDSKAFKRKRRIAMDVIASQKVPKIEVAFGEDSLSSSELSDNARTGFGFNSQSVESSNVLYKGGISFVKAETLNLPDKKTIVDESDARQNDTADELQEIETTVEEKLSFLCEGKEQASTVQSMSIQLSTLSTALKEGALSSEYLRKWLQETCSELINLEKAAAPAGWLLKWDRSNKRYFYQNQQTNETQWEYPEVDIIGGTEAMDISTTPPPTDESPITPPPPPPVINEQSMSPPPAPAISKTNDKQLHQCSDDKNNSSTEPLPPGVEISNARSALTKDTEKSGASNSSKDSLVSELDSFYSDIASIESNAPPPVKHSEEVDDLLAKNNLDEEQPKKKKKTKVKISHGLTMKKKDVSKLVEKWNNVQKNYSD